jgi:hypothetical protein
MPQRSHTRPRTSGRWGGSSDGCPQREQKRIGLGRSARTEVHERSILISAVIRSIPFPQIPEGGRIADENTKAAELRTPATKCIGSEADLARKRQGARTTIA